MKAARPWASRRPGIQMFPECVVPQGFQNLHLTHITQLKMKAARPWASCWLLKGASCPADARCKPHTFRRTNVLRVSGAVLMRPGHGLSHIVSDTCKHSCKKAPSGGPLRADQPEINQIIVKGFLHISLETVKSTK